MKAIETGDFWIVRSRDLFPGVLDYVLSQEKPAKEFNDFYCNKLAGPKFWLSAKEFEGVTGATLPAGDGPFLCRLTIREAKPEEIGR